MDVGDGVKKGALIAKIDPTDTVTQLEQARADYQASNARLQQAVANLQIQKDATEAEIQQAEQELALTRARELQARLQMKAQPSLSDAAIAQAEADLKASQDELEQLQVATIPQEKAEARTSYDQAVADRENARKEYERQQALLARGFVAASTVDTATMRLKNAEASVRTAKARLDTIDQEHQARLHSARAAVEQAKAVLDGARTGYRMP